MMPCHRCWLASERTHGPSALASRAADADAGLMSVRRIERPPTEFSSEPAPAIFLVPLDGSSVAELVLPVARVVSTGFGASLRVKNVPAEPDDPAKDDIGEFLATASTGRNDAVVCLACRGHVEQPPFGHRDLADRVLQRLGIPALVVGPHCSSGSFDLGGPVVVCHDGSASASQILALAVTWAAALDVPIHLLHVIESFDVTPGREARANVADALDRLGSSVQVEWVRSSLPAGAIRSIAREVDASIVAMSTHGQTCPERALLGRTTAWVVREAFCPVLVRRPVGIPT
jgi:nucleotide-binding universal stress UspA family protein